MSRPGQPAPISSALHGDEGSPVKLHGWVHRTRKTGGLVFIVLRDSSGLMQCTLNKKRLTPEEMDSADKALLESSVELEGTLKKDDRAPGGVEVQVAKFKVVNFADRFPITEQQSEEFLLDNRHLWIRSQKLTAILKVRHTVFGAIHEYFRREGFYEFQSPILTPTAAEGGSTVFNVDYFGKKAFLAQTWQLYAEAAIFALERIYTIAPSFRAEKSSTSRHLTEYWHAEMEVAWGGLDDIAKHAEGAVSHIARSVLEKNLDDVKALGQDPRKLEAIAPPFPRLKYAEALDLLKKQGMEVAWGKDLRTIEEREIAKNFDRPVIVTHYPKEIMAFYKPADPASPKEALCMDMLSPIGTEIVGGSVRSLDVEDMRKRLEAEGESMENYEWYFDLRKYGSVPHAGFGMGVERMVQWLLNLENIKDAIPFPRTMERVRP
jgi:asparaginyl-tRNA synthetase